MLRNLLTAVLLFTGLYAGAWGSNDRRSNRYGNTEGGYYYIGSGSMLLGRDELGGGEVMVLGNVLNGWLLAGFNANIFRGNSTNNYNYTFSGVTYKYRAYGMGGNIGIRAFSGRNIDFTIQGMFGEEIVMFGAKKTSEGYRSGPYQTLLSNSLWYAKPAISFNNKRNFALTASYNFFFNDRFSGSGKLAFGDSATDFNGPAMSFVWITRGRHQKYLRWYHVI